MSGRVKVARKVDAAGAYRITDGDAVIGWIGRSYRGGWWSRRKGDAVGDTRLFAARVYAIAHVTMREGVTDET